MPLCGVNAEKTWDGTSLAPSKRGGTKAYLGGEAREDRVERRKDDMLWTILAILWCCGYSVYSGQWVGSLIHLLLVAAVIILLVQLLTGRRPSPSEVDPQE
jgi:hypothetical protein